MTPAPAAQLLIRAACRRLPGDVREEHRREWSAELLAILHDPGIQVAALRQARALSYAAGLYRGAGRLYRPAPGARPAVTARGRWASRSRRRPLNRPKLAGGVLPAVAAVLTWVSTLVLISAFPPHGGRTIRPSPVARPLRFSPWSRSPGSFAGFAGAAITRDGRDGCPQTGRRAGHR